jgi:peptidyl-prolyl cis-trans isomerase D
MIGVKQWPDSVKVRHILIGTIDPRSQQMMRADSTAKNLVDSIENAVKTGADFNLLVAQYSDDQGSRDKGGVYDYFPQGQMVGAFNDFAFDKPVGTKGVIKTEFGYHYMEVLGQKNPNPAYKIAYLAKPIIASNETVSVANTAASQFVASSKNAKQFVDNATKQNLSIMSAAEIKENDFTINSIGSTRSLVRWVYEKKTGDVSEPTEIGDRYIVAMIAAVNKVGLMSAAEARPLIEGVVRNEKKAKQIIETKMKGKTLDQISKSINSPILRADSLGFAASFVTGVGSEPKVVGAAFNKSLQGKPSELIAGSNGVFAVQGEMVGAKPNASLPDAVKEGLLQTRKMSIYRSAEALRKSATIKDFRSTFY